MTIELELFTDDAGARKLRTKSTRDDGAAVECVERVPGDADLTECIGGWCLGFLVSMNGGSMDKTISNLLETRLP